MDVSSFPEKLDELAGKDIAKLVLIYDRGYMRPQYITESGACFFLSTTEMPLYVLVYLAGGLRTKYHFDLPYKSKKTWTISIKAHVDTLSAILRKALTPNGPKTYFFHCVELHKCKYDLDLGRLVYKDIRILCQLNMKPPEVDGHEVKLGKNGEYLFNAGLLTPLRYKCFGSMLPYFGRIKIRRRKITPP